MALTLCTDNQVMLCRYPNATAEELESGDNVCIICREEMTDGSNCKKLPCSHIFHTSCLRSWFQRQQTCPTCRMDVLRNPLALGQPQTPAAAQRQQQPQHPLAQQPLAPNGEYAWPFPNVLVLGRLVHSHTNVAVIGTTCPVLRHNW